MRICIDLDGVICEIRKSDQSYAEVRPLSGAAETINALKRAGHYIIIQSARHSRTCQGNVGLILARQGLITLQWLERYGIPYDEIHFGKPWADIYIDDNAIRFESWDQTEPDGSNLPASSETNLRGENW